MGFRLEHQRKQFLPTEERILGCGALFDRGLEKQDHQEEEDEVEDGYEKRKGKTQIGETQTVLSLSLSLVRESLL